VLRPQKLEGDARSFHRCQYLIQLGQQPEAPGAATWYRCWRVPSHMQGLHWQQLLGERSADLSEQLVLLPGSHLVKVLAKLESHEYIHCYSIRSTLAEVSSGGGGSSSSAAAISSYALNMSSVFATSTSSSDSASSSCNSPILSCSSDGASDMVVSTDGELATGLLLELPRYRLEFELQQGLLASRQYGGFSLRSQQQLVDQLGAAGGGGKATRFTLLGFSQYLVLEKPQASRPAATLVLVPAGAVLPAWGGGGVGSVHMQVSSACDESLQVTARPTYSGCSQQSLCLLAVFLLLLLKCCRAYKFIGADCAMDLLLAARGTLSLLPP
jgi:hypothetical protein